MKTQKSVISIKVESSYTDYERKKGTFALANILLPTSFSLKSKTLPTEIREDTEDTVIVSFHRSHVFLSIRQCVPHFGYVR